MTSVETGQGADFSVVLRELRERRGLTREELGAAARASASTIKAIELGQRQPSPALRAVLLRVLGESPALDDGGSVLNCWIAPGFSPLGLLANVQATVNGPGGSLEQSALYLDPLGAAAWCALVGGRDYHTKFGLTFPATAAKAISVTKGAPLDVIALGCGDGRREVALSLALLDRAEQVPDLRLYLLDISQPLLSEAYQHASAALDSRRGVSVTAIQGNFHHLPRYGQLLYRPTSSHRRKLMTLLGGTFANLDNELRWVSDALSGFGRGDLFLCDVTRCYTNDRRQIPAADPALRNEGKLEGPAEEFFTGPLRRYQRREGHHQVDLRCELGPVCVVPGSYQIDLVASLKKSGEKMRRWVVARYRRYDCAELGKALGGIGWSMRAEVQQRDGGAPLSLCLFERI